MPDRDFDSKDPQNYLMVINEFADKLSYYDLSKNEHRLIWHIIRHTWGYKKAWSQIKWDYMLEKTKLTRSSLSYARKSLISRNIIHIKLGKQGVSYKINSKLSTWKNRDELEPIWPSLVPPMELKEVGLVPPMELKKDGKLVQPIELKKDGKLVQPIELIQFNPLNQLVQPIEPVPIKRKHIKKTINKTPPIPPSKKTPKSEKKKPSPKSKKRERACSLPAGFNLSLEMEKYALMKGIDIKKVDDFFDSFTHWASAKGIECVDWEAQFKTHVDNAPRFGKQYMAKT